MIRAAYSGVSGHAALLLDQLFAVSVAALVNVTCHQLLHDSLPSAR